MQRITETRFLLPETPTHVGPAFAGAGAIYAVGGVLLALLMWLRPPGPAFTAAVHDPDVLPALILRNVVGAGGGGGGGGSRTSLLQPKKTAPVPAIKPPEPQPSLVPVAEPVPPPEPTAIAAMVPAVPTDVPVAIVSQDPSPDGTSLGPGAKGAGGPGILGVGPGPSGGGLGPGAPGPNTGPGPYGPGDVDVQVVPVFTPKPAYTAEAVVRRQEGEVALSCIVLATGTVGSCLVTKSLEGNRFGLDDEALKAAARFVFKPATRRGQPVPVRVNIIIEFRMR
jgi:periplasmic protein TonB